MVGGDASGWVHINSWTPAEKLAKLADTMASSGHAPASGASSASR